jgi:hypothetical protein
MLLYFFLFCCIRGTRHPLFSGLNNLLRITLVPSLFIIFLLNCWNTLRSLHFWTLKTLIISLKDNVDFLLKCQWVTSLLIRYQKVKELRIPLQKHYRMFHGRSMYVVTVIFVLLRLYIRTSASLLVSSNCRESHVWKVARLHAYICNSDKIGNTAF